MALKRKLAILNLAGEFPVELANYFSSREIEVVNPLNDSTKLEWTHIFTKDVQDFTVIAQTHQTTEKDIHIVSLSKLADLREFILSGGKMVFDEKWLEGSMGGFILDKFFQEYAGISIEDNYPNFEEVGSFNVTNPFSTGEYLDRLVFNAFEKGMNALAIKTYFDHLLMYLTGLKSKGRVGMPLEVSYGTLNEVFGVQIHFFAQDLTVEDITMSLSSAITKRPEEYLLNISIQSADFFDFTYLTGVNKVVITGLWTSDKTIKVENRGLMFTNLSPSAKIGAYQSQTADAFILQGKPIEDMSSMVQLPEPEVEAVIEDVIEQTVEEDVITVIGPSEPEEEEVTVIGPSETEDELVTKVSGGKEEKEAKKVIKGSKEEKDSFSTKISGGKDDDGKGKMNVRSLGGSEGNAKSGQFDFKTLGNGGAGEKNSASANPFFKDSQKSEKEKELEEKLRLSMNDNERLKTKIKILAADVENSKKNKTLLNEINQKSQVTEVDVPAIKANVEDEELKKIIQQKLSESKQLNTQDMKKLNLLMERESKYLEEAKENELKLKKLQLEQSQREMVFTQELEKVQRIASSREVIIEKTKETMTRVLEKKEAELTAIRDRFEQVNKVLAAGPNQAQQKLVKDLEKQNTNLNKMLEVYKNKVTMLATSMESSKGDDTNFKDEVRRLGMLTTQLKTMSETSKRDNDKLKERAFADSNTIAMLRQEKIRLEQLLKKSSAEVPKAQANANVQIENELKKQQQQNQGLEVQLRETGLKVKDLERRLTEVLKNSKTNASGTTEDSSKKVIHLETSMKKLTTDLMASQNQTAELKKETNKIRSENQALQNQLAQTKKELEKLKPATPKTPSNGGKAA